MLRATTNANLIRKNGLYPNNLIQVLTEQFQFTEGPESELELTELQLYKLMGVRLSQKEQEILEQRWRFKKSLEETGELFGITKSRVQQIEQHALWKLSYAKTLKEHMSLPYKYYEEEHNARFVVS